MGGLVVPTSSVRGFDKLYGRLRKRLPKTKGEVKGRRLSEDHVVEVAEVLRKVDCIFEVVAIDVGLHAEDEVRYHRQQQAERG